MKDHPVIFSAPMVLALIAGRKTMTRRLAWRACDVCGVATGTCNGHHKPSPWQRVKPGDVLWVKENWRIDGAGSRVSATACRPHRAIEYRADGYDPISWCERSSMFMPRWASRLTLEVTAVKIERLQDITEEDARAEGMTFTDFGTYIPPGTASVDGGKTMHPFKPHQHNGWHAGDAAAPDQCAPDAVGAFANLWSRLHSPESWTSNPELACLTFTAHQQNIDAFKEARKVA